MHACIIQCVLCQLMASGQSCMTSTLIIITKCVLLYALRAYIIIVPISSTFATLPYKNYFFARISLAKIQMMSQLSLIWLLLLASLWQH